MVDEEKIKAQAKKIMDVFMQTMQSVSGIESTFGVEREEQTRKAKSEGCDPGFRQRMLDNAPRTKDGCVLAEKKHW